MNGFEGLALANKDYVADQYRRWRRSRSVDDSCSAAPVRLARPAGTAPRCSRRRAPNCPRHRRARTAGRSGARAFDLIHSYRELGHLVAFLGLARPGAPAPRAVGFGFSDGDLGRPNRLGRFRRRIRAAARLIARLQATYCGTIGVVPAHPDREQRLWLQGAWSRRWAHRCSPTRTACLLDQLVVAEGFEQFLRVRYPPAKRFSLEGAGGHPHPARADPGRWRPGRRGDGARHAASRSA
jgi:2-oxoglutarate dehydrogenase complex dehydrogenase (E1) component-like enzyme